MSQFQEKVFAACAKKEALFDESLGRYALRSMLAGAYLTMSTAVGIIGADVIATGIPALSRFVFAFIFAIGLVFVLIFNGELATSNMMFLTSGAYYGKIKVILDSFSLELAHLPCSKPHILEVNLCLNFKKKYSLLVLKKKLSLTKVWGAMPCVLCLQELILPCQLL